MADSVQQREFLTTSQAARLLSVSPDTVLKWVKAGKIESSRTLGGHWRIPRSALAAFHTAGDSVADEGIQPDISTHQYCWQYLARDGEVSPECRECITYRSRSRRCYELRGLPEGMGCLRVYCKSDCSECNYYRMVHGQGLNIILVSESARLFADWEQCSDDDQYQIRLAKNEYECSRIVERFRPDYVVVDCALGKKRTATVCRSLFNDARIPVARIILSSRTRQLKDYCDRETCGWITRPFTMGQLKGCIEGAA